MFKYVMIYLGIAVIAGATVPLQAGINSRLNFFSGSPVIASIISFLTGSVTLVVFAIVTKTPLPAAGAFAGAPWWIWTGGILGAFYVASCVILANKLGAVSMLALIMAGQMITSVVLDHYGLAGYRIQPLNMYKISGILLIIAGVFLIRFSRGNV